MQPPHESSRASLQALIAELHARSKQSWLQRWINPMPDSALVRLTQVTETLLQQLGAQQETLHQELIALNRTLVAHEQRLAEWDQTRTRLGLLSAQVSALAAQSAALVMQTQRLATGSEELRSSQAEMQNESADQRGQIAKLATSLIDQARQLREVQSHMVQLGAETNRLNAADQTLTLGQANQAQITDALSGRIQQAQADLAPLLRDRGPERPAEFAEFYLAFENQFRGTREEILQRQQVYLPHIQAARLRVAGKPWLDLGCGRGEWLEYLREQGIDALGVDDNEAMLATCRERGLNVVASDALAFLEQQAPHSLAGASAFHLIEHLPYRTMLALFRAAYRALAPGGCLIIETPNPQNVSVGACNFYMDVTHQRPIPPMTAEFIARHAGFSPTVLRLHPFARHAERDSLPTVTEREYCEMFYGPQDYAILAIR